MGKRGRGQVACYCIVLWTIGICLPTVARAGWVIEQIEYANPGAEGTKTIQYISKNRLKTVGEGNIFIMDFARDIFIASDQESRVYWSGTVDEYVQEVRKFQQAANNLVRQQLEEAMKEMTPEQRKAMEEFSQQMRGSGTPSPPQQPAKRPEVKVESTSETATIAGSKATKIMVYADGKPYQEVWLAKATTLKGDLDLKRMRGLQAKLAQAIIADTASRQVVEEDPAYEKMLDQGYPVKVVDLGESGEPESTNEVTRMEKRDIPDKEFQPPEGYRRIDLREFFQEELEKLRKGE